MFDHIPDTLFWPLWALLAFLVALAVGLALGALIRWCDTPANKYVDRDWHTEQRCKATRRGFKTRAGIQ